jgi:hypothetical protein
MHWWNKARFEQGGRRSNRIPRRNACIEHLEARQVLAAHVIISEIVADNEQGLRDEDGERVDWIELFNAGDAPANLADWVLTDDAMARDKWRLPNVTLNPNEYLLVFASGKDRRDPGGQLHTNFRLSADGEYLGLLRAANGPVESEFAPSFPALLPDTSFGYMQGTENTLLLNASDPVRAFVPTTANGGDQLGDTWVAREFDDNNWTSGPGGVGFELATGFEDHFSLDLRDQMHGVNSSAFVRIPFHVDNPNALLTMTMEMKYDDGYAAYLNGQLLNRRNTPASLSWDAAATTTHRDALAVEFETSDISTGLSALRPGTNVLAVQGLNSTLLSDDFLIATELHATVPGPVQLDTARFFARPTPAYPNGSESYRGLIAPVSASVERGIYEHAFDVTLDSPTPGATLVYTTDGSLPTIENGTAIAPPNETAGVSTVVTINRTTTLRYGAVRDGRLSSIVGTQTYLFLTDILGQDHQAALDAGYPERWGRIALADYGLDPDVIGPDDLFEGEFARKMIDALRAAPTVSLVMGRDELFGSQGIYSNSIRSGEDWERMTSFEFIDNEGAGTIQANAGLRIQGDNVRNFDNSLKQSFRIEFRNEYGTNRLQFPVFGTENPSAADSFDTLILRGGYNDSWSHTPATTQYIRDQWARATLQAMGQPQLHGRFVHVYLNGFYWGVYTMVERANAAFGSDYVGGEPEEWDTFNTGALRDGNRDAWSAMTSLARQVEQEDPLLSNQNVLKLMGKDAAGANDPQQETLLDMANYIDYLIVNFYGGNTDWPGRNYYAARRRGPDSNGFMYFAWDTEKILDHGEGATLTVDRTGVSDGAAIAYRYLRTNAEFRLMFADQVQRHFFNQGMLAVDPDNPRWDPDNPQRNQPAATYDQIARRIELPLVAESARWGDTQPRSTRTDGRIYTVRDWQSMRDRLFDRFFPERSAIVLQQFVNAGLYPGVAAPEFSQHGGQFAQDFQLEVSGPGDIYYTLDGSDPRQSGLAGGPVGGAIASSAIKYTGPVTLDHTTLVRARSLVNGEWSALNEAQFMPIAPPIAFSELMYHPADPAVGETFETEEYEFIELVNHSSATRVDLQGLRITMGVEFTFPTYVLEPGQHAVVVRNPAAFQQRYGNAIPIAGQYGGTAEDYRLNNGGETIELVDAFGGLIQALAYRDDWLPSTDGDGYSLVAVNTQAAAADFSRAENWRASLLPGGSPGAAESLDFTQDGQTNVSDIDRFAAGIRAGDRTFDVTGDGQVQSDDWARLISELWRVPFGDANLDGRFSSRDLVLVFQAGQYEDSVPGNSGWAQGDWDGDGDFTSRDLVFAFASRAYTVNARPDDALFADLAMLVPLLGETGAKRTAIGFTP